jgi:predicted membrane protein (TIGR00267 family)
MMAPPLEDGPLAADDRRWLDFMMKFELGLEKPDPKRAPISAATIGIFYFVGGLIPLLPYMFAADMKTALLVSVSATGVALLAFGAVKSKLTGVSMIKSSLQTAMVGGLAAGAAFYLASLFG